MILFTTSRKPSKNTRRLARAFSCFVPGSQYLTRGKKNLQELVELARGLNLKKICIFGERFGNPGSMIFYNLSGDRESILRIRGSKSQRFRKKQAKIFVEGERTDWFIKTFLIEECDKNAKAKVVANEDGVIGLYDGKLVFMIKWGDLSGNSKRSTTGSHTTPKPPTTA